MEKDKKLDRFIESQKRKYIQKYASEFMKSIHGRFQKGDPDTGEWISVVQINKEIGGCHDLRLIAKTLKYHRYEWRRKSSGLYFLVSKERLDGNVPHHLLNPFVDA